MGTLLVPFLKFLFKEKGLLEKMKKRSDCCSTCMCFYNAETESVDSPGLCDLYADNDVEPEVVQWNHTCMYIGNPRTIDIQDGPPESKRKKIMIRIKKDIDKKIVKTKISKSKLEWR